MATGSADWDKFLQTPPQQVNRDTGPIKVYFFDIPARLLDFIADYEYLVGCVAWITDGQVIEALGKRPGVSVIVDKPGDRGVHPQLARLNAHPCENGIHAGMTGFQYARDAGGNEIGELDRVRVVGFAGNAGAQPLMHHKFLVGCRKTGDGWDGLNPESVWIGSYNFTDPAATRHLESVVVVKDSYVAASFQAMWESIYWLSETLGSPAQHPRPEIRWDESKVPPDGIQDDFINDDRFHAESGT